MQALAKDTEKVGIESEKAVLAPIEVTLGEEIECVGTGTPVVGVNTAVKKKVRIVKKIVKKKVIRKVPKRVLVAPICDDSEKVASSNPNDNVPMEIEAFLPAKIEKPNVADDSREVENLKELEVSDREKGVCLVEKVESCRDESERSGLVIASLLADQNRIELQDREHDINNMDVEEDEGEEVVKEQLESSSKMDVGISKCTKGDESPKEHAGKGEFVGVKTEIGLSKDVKGKEGMKEQVEKREHIDLKLCDAVGEQEGVKELVLNSETAGSRVEQGLNERRVPSEELVASEWHMKQRMEIFIHGLDKETKEEDIRKVFEEVGEVIAVKLVTNYKTGKNRGFGFIKYASAGDAKSALMKYHSVEICGRPCRTAAVEGNDTILLSNIDKKWNSEYVLALLQEIGVKKIDKVSVVADPENTELNRGFAFLELETKKDAQVAYGKLQHKNAFRKHSTIKVAWAWAKPLVDPVKEEMHDSKSVYAENIPSSWDKEEVKDHFKIFGEIESVALAKDLRSTKRNDFAFINYKSREAALSCIEALTYEQSTSDTGPKAHLKVSLAKSIPKGKPIQTITESSVTALSKVKQKANQAVYKPHKPRNMGVSSISGHKAAKADGGSSTTAELVQLLREQASWKLGGPGSTIGTSNGHHQPSFGGKQPFTELASLARKSLYHDPRAYHQTRLEIPSAAHPRSVANCVAMTSLHYDQQRANYPSGSFDGVEANPRYFHTQTRDQAPNHGSSSVYRQMH